MPGAVFYYYFYLKRSLVYDLCNGLRLFVEAGR